MALVIIPFSSIHESRNSTAISDKTNSVMILVTFCTSDVMHTRHMVDKQPKWRCVNGTGF